jgi:hypothetical protein
MEYGMEPLVQSFIEGSRKAEEIGLVSRIR